MPSGFQDLLEDLFAPLGGVSFRRMFGGVGIFRDGAMLALIADDALYMKADETSTQAYEAEGCGPFVYAARGRTVTISYWRLPERLYDEPDEFREWALTASGVAERAKAKPPARRPAAKKVKGGGKKT
jgi:DNA transformation protein